MNKDKIDWYFIAFSYFREIFLTTLLPLSLSPREERQYYVTYGKNV